MRNPKDHSGSVVALHAWNDRKHALKKHRRKSDNTALHPSVHAIFSYYKSIGKAPSVSTKAPLHLPQ